MTEKYTKSGNEININWYLIKDGLPIDKNEFNAKSTHEDLLLDQMIDERL